MNKRTKQVPEDLLVTHKPPTETRSTHIDQEVSDEEVQLLLSLSDERHHNKEENESKVGKNEEKDLEEMKNDEEKDKEEEEKEHLSSDDELEFVQILKFGNDDDMGDDDDDEEVQVCEGWNEFDENVKHESPQEEILFRKGKSVDNVEKKKGTKGKGKKKDSMGEGEGGDDDVPRKIGVEQKEKNKKTSKSSGGVSVKGKGIASRNAQGKKAAAGKASKTYFTIHRQGNFRGEIKRKEKKESISSPTRFP